MIYEPGASMNSLALVIALFICVAWSFRRNGQKEWYFEGVFVHVDKKNGVYFDPIAGLSNYCLTSHHQVKRKQALLESNLPGIVLMTDKNTSSRGFHMAP